MKSLPRLVVPVMLAGSSLVILFVAGCASSYTSRGSDVKIAQKGDVITVRTTAYTHSEADHRKYGRKNALGTTLRSSGIRSAAADWSRFPVGTKFKLLETGETFIIDDYGSALVGTNTVDLYKPSRSAMNRWGVRHVDIKILEIGCYEDSERILIPRRRHRHCDEMVRSIEHRRANLDKLKLYAQQADKESERERKKTSSGS